MKSTIVLVSLATTGSFPMAWSFSLKGPFVARHPRQEGATRIIDPRLFLALGENNEKDISTAVEEKQGSDGRGENLGKVIRSMGIANNDADAMGVGSIVVAGREMPSLGIRIHQSYEIKEIFDQGPRQDGLVDKVPVQQVASDLTASDYTRYVVVYNENYHDKPVVVTPEEIGLTSMKQEIIDSVWMALPILSFWTGLCIFFANLYNIRYGGDFMDAMFRR